MIERAMTDHLPVGRWLESGQLYYRRLTPADVTNTYHGWLNDPKVNEYLETRFRGVTKAEMRDFAAAHAFDVTHYLLGIFLISRREHIGNITLSHINLDHLYSENLSYFIGDKSRWNQGYATEAVRRITEFGFDTVGLLRIEAGAHASHAATIRVLEKSGYHLENTCKRKMKHMGAYEDQLIYVRFKDD